MEEHLKKLKTNEKGEKQMQKIKQIKQKNSNGGITLIALVITIIVLLILAAVSIATLTGENGILTKANDAKVETRGASVEEQAKLWKIEQEADKHSNTKTAKTLDELLDYLEEENLITKEERETIETEKKITIGSKTIDFSYTPDGGSDDENVITGDKVTSANYGDRVDYEAAGKPGLIWRLFYDDADNVYLISSKMTDLVEKCVEYSHSLDYTNSKYNDGSNAIISDLRYLNQDWFDVLAETPSTSNSAKAVAYLMDQVVWGDYKDANNKATYAIGGPTIELFKNSFNATKETRQDSSKEISFTEVNENGYYDNTGSSWLTKDDNKGIYNIDGSSDWWLASPSSYNGGSVYFVYGSNGFLNGRDVRNSYGLRPMVIIPKSKFQYKILPELDGE